MRLLLVLLPALIACACTSYSVRLYPDPTAFRVIDETLVLNDAESSEAPPIAVLMRGDSVMVVGERRTTWEYEQDAHVGSYVVFHAGRRSYVPLTSLVTNAEYYALFGGLPARDSTSVRRVPAPSDATRAPGAETVTGSEGR